MSIYGAMFSGVSGLAAQSQALGMISDNISNVNTVGYKATKARFSTLVTASPTANSYSPGGVRSSPQMMIDRQGLLQSSESPMDIAVSGDGFFVVAESTMPTQGDAYSYTRAGSFTPDAAGFLRNTAGFFLQGWRLDPNGNLAPGVNPNVLSSLETVNINNLTGTVESTEEITVAANLPASAPIVAAVPTSTVDMSGNISRSSTLPNTTTQSFTIYDDAGAPYTVTLTYTQTAVGVSGGADVGWDVQVTGLTDSLGGNALTSAHTPVGITYDFDTGALTSAASFGIDFNALTTGPSFNAGGSTAVDMVGTTSTIGGLTLASSPNGSASLANSPLSATFPMTVEIFDSLGVAYDITVRYVKTGITASAPITSTWDVYVQDLTRVSDGAQIAGAPSDPDDPATWGTPFGSLTFNDTGQLIATSAQPAPAPGTPLTLDLDMTGYSLTNGATWVDGTTNSITMNVGIAGTQEGLTQFSGEYLVSLIEQDGVQFGSFTSVQIDEAGTVTAIFDNGRTLPIFQVPLATFANANGLLSRTGNVYIETTQSGQFFLRAPNSGGAGQIESGALEASTVDLATEFTDMIITQRAYSASAKIITTADEMLDELVRIKR